jgi:hypothetical protein
VFIIYEEQSSLPGSGEPTPSTLPIFLLKSPFYTLLNTDLSSETSKSNKKNPNNRNLFIRSFLFFWKSVISFRPFFYFLFLLLFWFGFCDVISRSVVILVWRSVVISRSGLCDVVVSVAEVVGWCLCVWLVVFVML